MYVMTNFRSQHICDEIGNPDLQWKPIDLHEQLNQYWVGWLADAP